MFFNNLLPFSHLPKSWLLPFLVLVLGSITAKAQQKTNLSVYEFEQAIADSNIQILDVRTQQEFEAGYILHAFLANWNNKKQFQERVSSLDKSKPVYTYCLVGGRSAAAVQWLQANGFEAYNLEGGINKWKLANKKVEVLKASQLISYQSFLDNIKNKNTVLVDVGAFWCPPCKKMEPIVKQVISELGKKVAWVKIDGNEQTELAKQLKVDAFPTFIVYKNGQEVWRKQGVIDAEKLKKALYNNCGVFTINPHSDYR